MYGYRSHGEGFMSFGSQSHSGCSRYCPNCNPKKKSVSWFLITLMACMSIGEIYYGWINIDTEVKDSLSHHAYAAFDNANESTQSVKQLVSFVQSKME